MGASGFPESTSAGTRPQTVSDQERVGPSTDPQRDSKASRAMSKPLNLPPDGPTTQWRMGSVMASSSTLSEVGAAQISKRPPRNQLAAAHLSAQPGCAGLCFPLRKRQPEGATNSGELIPPLPRPMFSPPTARRTGHELPGQG